jgi:signal transduction histidine kinase
MRMRFILLLLFLHIYSFGFSQEKTYLGKILDLEIILSKEKFLDTILKIKYDKALTDTKKYLILVQKAKEIAENFNDKKNLAKAYEKISLAYHFSSKTELSIENNIKASKIYEQENDIENFANTYINLGWQIKNRNLEKAILYMDKGIKTLEIKIPESIKLIGAYNNYGVLKQKEKQLDSALYFHKKSLFLSIKNNDSISIPFAQTHIAEIYIKKKQFKNAEKTLQEALFIRKKRNDTYGITDSYLYLGDLHYSKKGFDKAINFFKKSEKLAIQNSYFPLRKYATEYIYKCYEKKGDANNALKYFKTFTKLKDSIFNKSTNSKIAELEIKFKTKERQKEIADQKKILLEKELSIKNRTLYLILLAASLTILVLFFIANYRKNQFKKKQLQKEIDLKDALATIKTQNRLQEQRLRISRDLHDNIGSQLTFIISSLDNLKYITKDTNKKLKEKLTGISSFTSETIHQLRDTIWAMNKSKITVEDLHSRILSFVEKAKSATENISFEVNYDIDTNMGFSSLVGMNIFRVIQEAINNAIKYSEANSIKIDLQKNKTKFIAIVKDNGIGFDKNTVDLGNGLSNMEKRMIEVSGKINIDSQLKKGTQITLEVHLENTSNDV